MMSESQSVEEATTHIELSVSTVESILTTNPPRYIEPSQMQRQGDMTVSFGACSSTITHLSNNNLSIQAYGQQRVKMLLSPPVFFFSLQVQHLHPFSKTSFSLA